MNRAGRILAAAVIAAGTLGPVSLGANEAAPKTPSGEIPGATLQNLTFADLAGWAADDHGAAFATFRRSCPLLAADRAPPAISGDDLAPACAAAETVTPGQERAFFERQFSPVRVTPDQGRAFLTGYFEPEYEGSLTWDPAFSTPLLARPDDLVTLVPGETAPGLEANLSAARRTEAGLAAYPDRAAIEDGALGARAQPVVYLRDPVDALIVHVQGSARIRLPDGRTLRVAYAGKNGHPFTAVGRVIVERGLIPLAEMTLARWTGWLKAHPAEARDIIRQNRSYIFFRLAPELSAADGPVGGLGAPLTPGRSLAIDRKLWPYGLPVHLDGELPRADGGQEALGRLMVAQDTGSAITGPARADFFWGSGEAAGVLAGLTRQSVRFTVLRPRSAVP